MGNIRSRQDELLCHLYSHFGGLSVSYGKVSDKSILVNTDYVSFIYEIKNDPNKENEEYIDYKIITIDGKKYEADPKLWDHKVLPTKQRALKDLSPDKIYRYLAKGYYKPFSV